MAHNGNESLQLHIAIQLIDGLLFPVARWPDVYKKALRIRNTLADWAVDRRVPTAKEWQFIMEDVKTIRDWLQDRTAEAQDLIDSTEPRKNEEKEG